MIRVPPCGPRYFFLLVDVRAHAAFRCAIGRPGGKSADRLSSPSRCGTRRSPRFAGRHNVLTRSRRPASLGGGPSRPGSCFFPAARPAKGATVGQAIGPCLQRRSANRRRGRGAQHVRSEAGGRRIVVLGDMLGLATSADRIAGRTPWRRRASPVHRHGATGARRSGPRAGQSRAITPPPSRTIVRFRSDWPGAPVPARDRGQAWAGDRRPHGPPRRRDDA
jgi:hypothetical protein